MVLSGEITARIRQVLEKHPEGISITDLVKSVDVNRNTAGRYLENLLLSGQVEMRRFGMAKMYMLTKRLPISSVLSLSSELVMQLDSGQRVFYANDPLLTFLGAPAKDLFGKNIEFTPFSTVFEDVFIDLLDRFRKGLRGEEWHGELSCPVQERFFFCRITPTVSNEGKKGVSVILEDISDRKRDEKRIRKSEARLRSIFRVSPVGIGVVADRNLLEVNDRFCWMTGYSPAEIVGESARILYPSEEAFRNVRMLYTSQIRQSGNSTLETRWLKKDGTIIDILLNSTPLDPANISGGITFTALDITERKRSEQNLRESEAKLQLALSGSEMGMWEMYIPSMKGLIDERAAVILGYQKSTIGPVQADWDALSHPDDVPLIHQRLLDYLEGRTSIFESEHRMWHASGRWIWVVGRGKITQSLPDGSSTRISGTMQEITARKQAEQVLRESEEKFRTLFEGALNPVMIVNTKGRYLEANEAALRFLETGKEELLKKTVWDYSPKELVKTQIQEHSPFTQPRTRETAYLVHGRLKTLILNIIPLEIKGEQVLIGIGQDITARKQAEQALRESESTARALLNAPTDTIILLDNRGVILDLNETAVLRLAKKREDVVGILSDTVLPPDLAQERKRKISEVLATRKPVRFTDERRGTWFDNVVYPILDNQGNVARLAIIARDITDQKTAEAALRESEEKYRNLVEQSLQGLTILQNGRPVFANAAMLEISGFSSEEYLALSPEEMMGTLHSDDRQRIAKVMADRLKGKKIPPENEFRILRKNGTIRWVLTHGTLITYHGAPAIQIAYFDITPRKLAEDALRESEDRYRKLVEISPNAVILHRDGKVIYVNPALVRLLRAGSAGDLLGKNVLDLLQPSHRERIQANIVKDLTGEPTPFMELQMLRADGTTVFVEGQGAGTTIDGMPAVLVAINDITEHHHASLALKESEERYRTLAEASQDLIYLVGRDDRVEYVNSYAAAIMRLSSDEIIGKKRSSLFSGELGERQAQGLRRVFETGKTMRSEGAMEIFGTMHWFDHSLMPITDAQGRVTSVLGVSRDITDRKETENALRASEERYRSLLGQTFDAVVIHKDKRIISLNERAAQILGAATPGDLMGRPIFDRIHPDSARDLEERIRMIAADPAKPALVLREKFIRVDGTTVTVDVIVVRIMDNGVPAIQVMFREIASPEPK